MRLRLRFFAAVREALGSTGRDLDVVVAPASIDELLDLLDRGRTHAVLRDPRLRIAVNGQLLGAEAPLLLADGDEVAILPPVTGG
jgi:molybdopterin synthase sulfur carrier subunit